MTPNTTVEMAPPIKPSQVFFGDSLIRGVRPKKKPNMYAMMSLQMIIDTGTKNLNTGKGQMMPCLHRYAGKGKRCNTP